MSDITTDEITVNDPRTAPVARLHLEQAAHRRAELNKLLAEAAAEERDWIAKVAAAEKLDAATIPAHEIVTAAETDVITAAQELKDAEDALARFIRSYTAAQPYQERVQRASERYAAVVEASKSAVLGVVHKLFPGNQGRGIFQVQNARTLEVENPFEFFKWLSNSDTTDSRKKKLAAALQSMSYPAALRDYVEMDAIHKEIGKPVSAFITESRKVVFFAARVLAPEEEE